MADPREALLAQLLVVAGAVEGVQAAARNTPDVPGLARPAIIMHDGAETLATKPDNERQARLQIMELTPSFVILLGADATNIGTLMNIYRARLLLAITSDATTLALINPPTGEIRFDGCTVEPANAEAKEGRMLVHMAFTYVFRLSDLP